MTSFGMCMRCYYTACQKNETRVILNICTIVSLLQWNLARDILMALAIKRRQIIFLDM